MPLTVDEVATDGWRRRAFARLLERVAGRIDARIHDLKDALLTDVPHRVIEIGPGTGTNFRHYPPGTTVVAVEPNRYLHDDLRRAAREHGLHLELQAADLRSLALPPASETLVVSSLVLCSVPDRPGLAREIRRILGPGGRFVFIEHVAEDTGFNARLERALRRPWAFLFDDCDLRSDALEAIGAAGFSHVDWRTRHDGPAVGPARVVAWGTATV